MNELKPDSIVYNLEQTGFQKPKVHSLCLIIPAKKYYAYVDFPKGDSLRETRISIHKEAFGTRSIEDENIRVFLKIEFGDKLSVYSYWIT